MVDYDVWRKQIDKMSDEKLDIELGKRRTNWYEMIVAETLRRILRKLNLRTEL